MPEVTITLTDAQFAALALLTELYGESPSDKVHHILVDVLVSEQRSKAVPITNINFPPPTYPATNPYIQSTTSPNPWYHQQTWC